MLRREGGFFQPCQRVRNREVGRGRTSILLGAIASLFLLESSAPIRSGRLVRECQRAYDECLFRDGDLVFRQGRGIFSGMFASMGKVPSRYSHVGMIAVRGARLVVIHADASELTGRGFVREEPVETFLNDAHAESAALYRVSGREEDGPARAARIAAGFAEARVPFDSDFDLSTEDALYCTEMVWVAYDRAGVRISEALDRMTLPLRGEEDKPIISTGSLLAAGTLELVARLKD